MFDMRPLVIIESPYAGDVLMNVEYAKKACRDSYLRGEMPFASHLLYPQFLFDSDVGERSDGIMMGYRIWNIAHRIAFYTDRGWSNGMLNALATAHEANRDVELRALYGELVMPPE